MKTKVANFLKFFLFFIITLFLLWLVFRKQSFNDLLDILKNQVNYFWIILSGCLGMLSHISRAVRWNILIESLGKKPKLKNSFLSVMVGYFANLALPRMGEITRCGLMKKYEKISFSKLLGTVVTERVIDLLSLFVFLILAIVTQFSVFRKFWFDNPEITNNFTKIISSIPFLIGLVLIIILLWFFRKKFNNFILYQKIKDTIKNIILGIKSIKYIKHKGWFIFHSIFIWTIYYLMFYITFFAFEFTSDLGPLVALTLFVLGSLGFAAPVQGGIGAFHVMIIGGLLIYLPNIDNIENLSRSYAIVVHGIQALLFIVFGSISLILLPIVNRKTSNN